MISTRHTMFVYGLDQPNHQKHNLKKIKKDLCQKTFYMKKMNNKKEKTKSFNIEFETGLTKKDRDLCEKKLRIGRSMYNAFLGEALKRYSNFSRDPRMTKLRELYQPPKARKKELKAKIKAAEKKKPVDKKAIKIMKEELREIQTELNEYGAAMNQVKKEYGWFGKYSLADMRKEQSHHFKGAIGSSIASTLSQRAFRAVERMEIDPATDTVNFVKKDKDFSIEGNTNDNGIIYKNGLIYFDIRKDQYVTIKPARKKDEEYYNEALQNRVKYCRLLSRVIRGRKRYYVQVILEGTPPDKRKYGTGKIEILDVKISHAEMKKKNGKTEIVELAPGCRNPEEKIAELDRRMDASRRASNPGNYNENGTIKEGANNWVYSNNYRKLAARRKELYRSMKVRRKIAHEELVNRILAEGTDITIRHLSYKEQQQRSKKETEINPNTGRPYSKARQGKNIGNRAPSEFLSILSRKLSYIDKTVEDQSKEQKEGK